MLGKLRPLPALSILPVLTISALAAACDSSEPNDDTVATVNAALSTSAVEGDGQALGIMAFPRGVATQRGVFTAQQRVDHIKAWVADNLTCAEAVPVAGDDAAIQLEMSRDCAWAGRRWTGTITITYTADAATMEFEGLTVNGGTLTGDMTVTHVAEGHVTVSADWTTVRANGRTVVGAWDAEWTWDDAAYTIVAATHQVTVDGEKSATLTKANVVWQRGDVAPESGTVTFTGFRGRTWTMTFGRAESGELTITVVGQRGTRTFTVPARTETDV